MAEKSKSCWFYDDQLLDRMTSVSLHANTYLDNERKWKKYEVGAEGVDKGGYCKAPLCTSILQEDFQVSISNTWNEVGGDPVSSAWDQMVRPVAPYAGYAKEVISQISTNVKTWGDKKAAEGKLSDTAHQMTQWAGKLSDIVERNGEGVIDYMNSVLISQGTRFSYYSGSGVSFGNLQMRFTMFPIWATDGTFLSVPQQLELLFPYSMGTYTNLYLGEAGIKEANGVIQKGDKMYSTLLGWQHPPGGYQAVYEDIDKSGIKGTLKLRIGSFYVLESLVCDSMSFNLSRQMVKRPMAGSTLTGPGWSGITKLDTKEKTDKDKGNISNKISDQMAFSPLFADVILSFRPATKYSDNTMKHFIYGLNIAGDTNEGGQAVSNVIKDNLKTEINRLSNIYGK